MSSYGHALVFDLDDTLAPSKSRLSTEMARELVNLLDRFEVCIISGGRYEQFVNQVLAVLPEPDGTLNQLTHLHLMPTCGSVYYQWEPASERWQQVYAESLTATERDDAISAVESSARALGLWEPEPWGDRIEDRGAQITFSALGQQAPLEAKRSWDPDSRKKDQLRDQVQRLLPGLEVRSGGSTSIDITRQGIDKAYGIKKLVEHTGLGLDRLTFFGDRLDPMGNDFPVVALGVRCIAVEGPDDTLVKLRAFLA